MFFRRNLAPAQRAVGDCSPLKESPGRVPAAGEFFLLLLIKINDFFMKIIIIFVFTDVFSVRILLIIMKMVKYPKYFEKIKKNSKIVETFFEIFSRKK